MTAQQLFPRQLLQFSYSANDWLPQGDNYRHVRRLLQDADGTVRAVHEMWKIEAGAPVARREFLVDHGPDQDRIDLWKRMFCKAAGRQPVDGKVCPECGDLLYEESNRQYHGVFCVMGDYADIDTLPTPAPRNWDVMETGL